MSTLVSETNEISRDARTIEDRLWTEYMVALAQSQECWRLSKMSWHDFVAAGMPIGVVSDAHDELRKMHDQAIDREQAAYAAWKKVAYPLYTNLRVNDAGKVVTSDDHVTSE